MYFDFDYMHMERNVLLCILTVMCITYIRQFTYAYFIIFADMAKEVAEMNFVFADSTHQCINAKSLFCISKPYGFIHNTQPYGNNYNVLRNMIIKKLVLDSFKIVIIFFIQFFFPLIVS